LTAYKFRYNEGGERDYDSELGNVEISKRIRYREIKIEKFLELEDIILGISLNGINITRVHLEEDTASSSHDAGDFSLVDFNRAGVPLMELVTEPELHSGKETADFARELQLLLQYLSDRIFSCKLRQTKYHQIFQMENLFP
jgi:Asp-tRNA(Asn)/Glu-tRNA(Gln) amidotransferase B subunit